jgi:arylsulfatase A-like enzyme/Tfp pilus assembly protein PilF
MRDKRRVKLWILVVLLLAAAAVAVSMLMVESRPSIRSVLLISIDTCRADRLSCYGFPRKTTPNIDAIAQEGVLFENAYTPVALTLPAHCSMLTGMYPPSLGVHDNLNYQLDESKVTIAEILREQGYTTGAVISSFVLDGKFGLGQGFDSYYDKFEHPIIPDGPEQRGDEASRIACSFLEQHKDKPFFLFLHYYDPHTAYAPPQPYASEYADDLYSGEIAYTDSCIGQVIEKMKGLGLYDSTLLIIVGDHGEGLGEHGETEHGYYIYQSTVRVPFIIRPPAFRGAKRVKDVVSLVDVVPTVLSYLGIAIPDGVQGKDLSDYASRGTSEQKRQLYCESLTATKYGCNPLLGLIDEQWKYIETTRPELYNLPQDPLEENNLLEQEPKRGRFMQGQLQEMMEQLTSKGLAGSKPAIDEENIRRLESLGYVGTEVVDDSFKLEQDKQDPKDLISYHEDNQKVLHLISHKQFDEARKTCAKLLQDWPDTSADRYSMRRNCNIHYHLTQIAFDEKKFGETIEHGLRYLALLSGTGDAVSESSGFETFKRIALVHNMVAEAAYKLEKFDQAEEQWNEGLRLIPEWPEVHVAMAAMFFRQGKTDKAIEHWTEALRLRPDLAEIHNNLAAVLYQQGKIEEAIKHWKEALRLKPDWQEVRDNLDKLEGRWTGEQAVARYTEMLQNDPNNASIRDSLAAELYQQGKIDQAIEQWKEVIRLKPEWAEAQNSLATAYYRQGDISGAIKHWREAVRLKPDWAEAMNNLAWVLAAAKDQNLRNTDEAVRLAERSCELTKNENTGMLDTLAVAYAAGGRFTDAIGTAEKAVELARVAGEQKLAEEIQKRLELYKMNKPYSD